MVSWVFGPRPRRVAHDSSHQAVSVRELRACALWGVLVCSGRAARLDLPSIVFSNDRWFVGSVVPTLEEVVYISAPAYGLWRIDVFAFRRCVSGGRYAYAPLGLSGVFGRGLRSAERRFSIGRRYCRSVVLTRLRRVLVRGPRLGPVAIRFATERRWRERQFSCPQCSDW